jgi:uncharacterized membrane protein YidH (DUF202 family)
MESQDFRVDTIAISEVQLVLAEKRTSLAVMRTGIAVLVLPLSVLSVLIATSKYYDFIHVLHLMVPLLILSSLLAIVGIYLVLRSVVRMHRYDKIILRIKQKHSAIAEFID